MFFSPDFSKIFLEVRGVKIKKKISIGLSEMKYNTKVTINNVWDIDEDFIHEILFECLI